MNYNCRKNKTSKIKLLLLLGVMKIFSLIETRLAKTSLVIATACICFVFGDYQYSGAKPIKLKTRGQIFKLFLNRDNLF
jgi:hypothetical protein